MNTKLQISSFKYFLRTMLKRHCVSVLLSSTVCFICVYKIDIVRRKESFKKEFIYLLVNLKFIKSMLIVTAVIKILLS